MQVCRSTSIGIRQPASGCFGRRTRWDRRPAPEPELADEAWRAQGGEASRALRHRRVGDPAFPHRGASLASPDPSREDLAHPGLARLCPIVGARGRVRSLPRVWRAAGALGKGHSAGSPAAQGAGQSAAGERGCRKCGAAGNATIVPPCRQGLASRRGDHRARHLAKASRDEHRPAQSSSTCPARDRRDLKNAPVYLGRASGGRRWITRRGGAGSSASRCRRCSLAS